MSFDYNHQENHEQKKVVENDSDVVTSRRRRWRIIMSLVAGYGEDRVTKKGNDEK